MHDGQSPLPTRCHPPALLPPLLQAAPRSCCLPLWQGLLCYFLSPTCPDPKSGGFLGSVPDSLFFSIPTHFLGDLVQSQGLKTTHLLQCSSLQKHFLSLSWALDIHCLFTASTQMSNGDFQLKKCPNKTDFTPELQLHVLVKNITVVHGASPLPPTPHIVFKSDGIYPFTRIRTWPLLPPHIHCPGLSFHFCK